MYMTLHPARVSSAEKKEYRWGQTFDRKARQRESRGLGS